MKIVIYFSCRSFPVALIAAAMHTGLIPINRTIRVSDIEHLHLLIKGRKEGQLIFVGLDKENNKKIYALTGSYPKELILRFIKSFLSLNNCKSSSFCLVDCPQKNSILLTLGWFLYKKNIFKFMTGYILNFQLKYTYHILTGKVEDVRSCINLP